GSVLSISPSRWCWIGREASAGYRNAIKTKLRAICSRHALDRRDWNPWSQWPIFNTLLALAMRTGLGTLSVI
ncbi:MAG: hypothetical protein AAF802_29640, partial [Planctomycetota bacterium]